MRTYPRSLLLACVLTAVPTVTAARANAQQPTATKPAEATTPTAPAAPTGPAAPTTPTLTAEQWLEDLDVLARDLPAKHYNLFFHRPKEDFERDVAALRATIPALASNPARVVLEFQRLAASFRDAHTSIDPGAYLAGTPFLPFVTGVLSDSVVISSTMPQATDWSGGELLEVNGVPIKEVIERVAAYYSWENEHWKLNRVPQYLIQADILRAAGIIEKTDAVTCSVRTVQGAVVTAAANTVPNAELRNLKPLERPMPGHAGISNERRREGYWFKLLPETRVLYVRYDRCADDPGHPVADFAKELTAELDKGGVERLIIDLRRNSGGNSALLYSFITSLGERKEFKAKGSVVALIGRGTFSSGLLAATNLRDLAGAVLIGLPTGQRPNSHGEMRTFTLPNSGITVMYSTKFFRTQKEDADAVMPEVLVEPTLADFRAGRDRALEVALEYNAAAPAGVPTGK